MIILGIESSCDETAVAIVKNGTDVLSSLINSQIDIHSRWGGVIPEIAAREHVSALQSLYKSALRSAQLTLKDIDAVAVTQGPGLVGCLLVGASFAKGLAQAKACPLIPINHVHAHVHGALLGIEESQDRLFPLLSLVVSGGHTNLYYMNSPTHYDLLAHTLDDACGESFDKVGKMLGLSYPGGPHVEKLARKCKNTTIDMPKMVERKSQMTFSYSGLKTAAANLIRNLDKNNYRPEDVAYAFQEEALGQLIRKLGRALSLRPETKSIVIAGGVAANTRFKELAQKNFKIPIWFPPLKYCSDNGAMIASMAYYELKKQTPSSSFEWDVFSRYPFETYMDPQKT
jgi:N6-L-threonylcarbamoyladenine synthase